MAGPSFAEAVTGFLLAIFALVLFAVGCGLGWILAIFL